MLQPSPPRFFVCSGPALADGQHRKLKLLFEGREEECLILRFEGRIYAYIHLLNFYRYEKTTADKEMTEAFISQTKLDTAITNPYAFSGSEMLLKKFGGGFHKGITVTCPGFFGPQGRVLRLGLASPGLVDKLTHFSFNNHRITNFEMETSAIYGLGKLMGHECLSINTIIANRVLKEFSKDSEAAVKNMIRKALEALTAS